MALASSGPLAVRGAEASPGADIVYSGRYYKPGKEVSRYHVWRIAADGSGRFQVTSHTNAADHSPVWLADGRTVLFVREEGGTNRLCTVNEGGGPVTTFGRGWEHKSLCPGSVRIAAHCSSTREAVRHSCICWTWHQTRKPELRRRGRRSHAQLRISS